MKALLTFYKQYGLPALLISCISGYSLWRLGSPYVIVYLFWLKLITNILLGLYFHLFRSKELYLYFNLGISAGRLYAAAFVLDFGIWVGFITIILQLV